MLARLAHIKHEIASPLQEASFSSYRMREIYSRIHILKQGKKDKAANLFLQKEIKSLREEVKYYLSSVYHMVYKNKNYMFEFFMESYPEKFSTPRKKDENPKEYLNKRYELFKESWKQYKSIISEERKKISTLKEESKEVLGFSYKMVGGVFLKNNSVKALQTIENQMTRIRKQKKPTKTQLGQYIGVELELIAKVNREKLNELLCKNFLAGYVYVKDDGSIKKEYDTDFTHEVTLLCKEEEVKNIITRLCSVLNSKQVDAYVNNTCGLHVHLDCRNRDPKKVFNNIVRCLPVLKTMVPKTRVETEIARQYCKLNKTNVFDNAGDDRYTAVNGPDAFRKYQTIEVRMHSGTTNAGKIINWVKILTLAASHTETFTEDIATPAQFATKTGCDSKLVEYIMKRVELFTGQLSNGIDTRVDHYFYSQVEAAV